MGNKGKLTTIIAVVNLISGNELVSGYLYTLFIYLVSQLVIFGTQCMRCLKDQTLQSEDGSMLPSEQNPCK